MIFDSLSDLNWLAVIVAALAHFALGAIWYNDVLFGKQWRAATGLEMGEGGKPSAGALVTNLVALFVAAAVLGLISLSIGADSLGEGVVLGLVVSAGIIGTNRVIGDLYEGRNMALVKINAPYTLLGYAIMGAILATWT